jgi:serine/threonine protein kinase
VDPSDWSRVNDLFHRALGEPPARRVAFLAEACAGAPAIRAEVQSLLDAHDRASDFIEAPPAEAVAAREDSGALAGRQIGQYRVLRVLGRGGMGVVYLAEDTRLGRTVALKSVAPRFTADEGRRERLRREARAAASLSHAGIATVYALEEFGAQLYIASEYVPGGTLRDELTRGPLSVSRAIETTLSLARALAAAHDRGIVHRDLKPENVVRTPAGDLKILDFGLARFRDAAEPLAPLTDDGTALGTPAYMSPEQARGRPVDFRSDIFSLGIILYELVAGVNPFAGQTTASTIVNILEAAPSSLIDHRPDLAGSGLDWIEQVARTCLRKDPDERYRSTHALVRALEEARDAVATNAIAVHRTPSGQGALATPSAEVTDPQWWWQFHQAAATIVYGSLLVPVWFARKWTGGVAGPLLFLAALVAVIVAGTLRLHLWFIFRSAASEWRTQRERSAGWIRLADVGFVAVLVGCAGFVLESHGDVAILLVGVAVAVLLSATVIEPATTRAAFPRD